MLITEYRLELVIQALRTILPLAHPADTTLRYFFKDQHIGSNERELVAASVFGVLRHRMLLEHSCTSNPPRKNLPMQPTVSGSGDGAAIPAAEGSPQRGGVNSAQPLAGGGLPALGALLAGKVAATESGVGYAY